MKKILVVLTGGTIGSRVEHEIINVSSTSPYRLLTMYEEKYGKEDFEVISPLNLLSENMTPEDLVILLKALENTDCGSYAGIIVTHGSDTLSFTSAFVGLLFHYLPVPLVLVASNYPLGQEKSNGLDNFAGAVQFIREQKWKGVFTLYANDRGERQVYLSTRICEADPYLDQFHDFSGMPLGRIKEQGFTFYTGKNQPGEEELMKEREKPMAVPESLRNRVLLIRPYPGLDYSLFRLDGENRPAAVLHYLYHSATACLREGNYDLLAFANECRERGIAFYTASHKHTEGKLYATGDALLKEGVIPLLNISPEAAYAKLMLFHNSREKNRDFLQKNVYFEKLF
jgi:L-asparaginase